MYKYQEENRFPKRKNPRLKEYDYNTPNYYFVTICTDRKTCIFGSPEKLNKYGIIAKQGIEIISDHFSGVLVDKYVVMPNHVHIIIVLTTTDKSLLSVVGSYKSYVTKYIHKFDPIRKVWQKSFHEHIIRNQKSYEKIWNYIETNPIRWEEDCFYKQQHGKNLLAGRWGHAPTLQ